MADISYQYLEPSGVIVADTSQILATVQAEWQTALGQDLVVTPDTPQGVMITAEALARDNVVKNNAALANQINPNVAGGVFLDAILALTGVQRNVQVPTVAHDVALTGVPGTIIPIGVQAKTAAGDIFQSTSSVTLSAGGTATVDFQSAEYGPIPCAVNALNNIVTAVLGWETVTNPTAGVLGTTTQSDQSARAYRKNTLAFQGKSLLECATSALYATPGVASLKAQENISAVTATINGITMLPHSVYFCVDGGIDTDVAAALLENKSSGAAWNGGTTVNIIEPSTGQSYPVKFDRPDDIGILINVTASNVTTDAVVQAILDYADGLINGLQGFVVGADVSPFELAGAIMSENPGAYVSLVEISLSTGSPSFSTTPISIGVNQKAVTQLSYITVTIA